MSIEGLRRSERCTNARATQLPQLHVMRPRQSLHIKFTPLPLLLPSRSLDVREFRGRGGALHSINLHLLSCFASTARLSTLALRASFILTCMEAMCLNKPRHARSGIKAP